MQFYYTTGLDTTIFMITLPRMEKLSLSTSLLHPLAVQVCSVLQMNGHQSFIVGGCVRDLILGEKPKDWDLCTNATPQQVMELFPKNIPTGLQHGTITVCMGSGEENHFEVTTFRVEGKYSDGRRPDQVQFVSDIKEDLARRDLTINAMAYDPIAGRLEDPFDGYQDLKYEIIRAVGNPIARFQEDGLRIMRVARFAARFDYQVHIDTFRGMSESLDTLKKVSKERLSDELSKILMSNHSSYGLNLLSKTGALDIVCPLLTGRQFHWMDRQCQGSLETRLAFLYNKLPAVQVQEELGRLKFSNKEIKRVGFLLELVKFFSFFQEQPSAEAYKVFMAILKNNNVLPWEEALEQFLQLAEAMQIGAGPLLDEYGAVVIIPRKEMQINGEDLLEIGMVPGPKIKKALDACYVEVLRDHQQNSKGKLIQLIRDRLLY